MRQRCNNPTNKDYPNYGGRGIKICPEWNDFLVFQQWALANGYDPLAPYGECTIDRRDVNGDYSPENCRITNSTQQNRNKTNTLYVTYENEILPCSELAERLQLDPNILYQRIVRGWSIDRAIHQPVRGREGQVM